MAVTLMAVSAASVMPLVSVNARSVQSPAFHEVYLSPALGPNRSQMVREGILRPGHGVGRQGCSQQLLGSSRHP